MEAQAAETGRAGGVAMGEAFHYERFHPLIEAALKGSLVQDFTP